MRETLRKINKYAEPLKEFAEIISGINRQSTVISNLGAALQLGQFAARHLEKYLSTEDIREGSAGEGWLKTEFLESAWAKYILQTEKYTAQQKVIVSDEQGPILCENSIGNTTFRYFTHTDDLYICGYTIDHHAITKIFWEVVEGDFFRLYEINEMAVYAKEIIQPCLPLPAQFNPLLERTKAALAEGHSRSLLFYGPPGYGKTTVARALAKALGLKAILLRGEMLYKDSYAPLSSHCAPACIIDDIENQTDSEIILHYLEHMKTQCHVTISTCNDPTKLTPAMRRPGRIDESILVNALPPELIQDTLHGFPEEVEHVKHWPIAHIKEYAFRLKHLAQSETREDVRKSLQALVDEY